MAMGRPRTTDRDKIRSERFSLVLTPVTYDGVRAMALAKGISVNDLIATILEGVVKKNATVIENFYAAQREAAAAINLDVPADATPSE